MSETSSYSDSELEDSNIIQLACVGSRMYNNYQEFDKNIRETFKEWNISMNSRINLISGGAKGTDKMAEEWATKNSRSITIFRPNWDKYGKGAGPRRNAQIIDAATHCIAFPSKMGKGTQDSIRKANRKGIPLKVIYID